MGPGGVYKRQKANFDLHLKAASGKCGNGKFPSALPHLSMEVALYEACMKTGDARLRATRENNQTHRLGRAPYSSSLSVRVCLRFQLQLKFGI